MVYDNRPAGATGAMNPGKKPTDEWLEDFTKEEIRAIIADLEKEENPE